VTAMRQRLAIKTSIISDWLTSMTPQNFGFATPDYRPSTPPPLTPPRYTIARRHGEKRYARLSRACLRTISGLETSWDRGHELHDVQMFASHMRWQRRFAAKSRTIMVRLISMAMTGYYRTLQRPRAHQPLSMLKYDPIGTTLSYPNIPPPEVSAFFYNDSSVILLNGGRSRSTTCTQLLGNSIAE